MNPPSTNPISCLVSWFYLVIALRLFHDSRDTLKRLCSKFGVQEKSTFDCSKKQIAKNTTFMKTIHSESIDYLISEADMHNQNLVGEVVC